eukprot:NODE_2548_length_1092_cov_23.253116_g2118_i0.p2 GENE.NODE_2548_length_1092_cov_23.253116_g2118_i0~~NODE_2548_length_1092_cov_23.253116_g2118_i0.p2  ORF type:complete len:306 (-),score=90.80 NODE_2548_length_1092_cov_23.253116_g2118_i0:50-967(-)
MSSADGGVAIPQWASPDLNLDALGIDQPPDHKPAFNMDLVYRNHHLVNAGMKVPAAMKTGTTTCGACFDGGVVIAADTRATMGSVVAEKFCEKIHYLAPNIWACGAGTSADTMRVTEVIAGQLALQRLTQGKQSRIIAAKTLLKKHLFRYQGHIGAYLILGGVDVEGPHLMDISAHGSTKQGPFMSMGSGCLAALAELEKGYKDKMTKDECIALVTAAISAGILNDLGSGSQVDICVITKDKPGEVIRGVKFPSPKTYEPKFRYPLGTTPVISETIQKISFEIESERVLRLKSSSDKEKESMDTS